MGIAEFSWTRLAVIGAIFTLPAVARAGDATLNFSVPVPGTVQDVLGDGVGFPNRLSGTGALRPASDPNLDLNTVDGLLRIEAGSTDSEFNANKDAGNRQALGFNLANLGLTAAGNEAFTITGTFSGLPTEGAFDGNDQFGLYVATGAEQSFRTGVLQIGGASEFYAITNNGSGDNGGNFYHNAAGVPSSAATSLTFTISRAANGIYSATANGIDITPTGDQSNFDFLRNSSLLNAGVYVTNANSTSNYAVQLDSFSVSVVPEPSMVGGAAIGAFCLLARRKRKCGAC